MQKHRFNIFPEMQPEDYSRLVSDLTTNGFDIKQPIYIYEGEVLDGWNRLKACNELGIQPITRTFMGSDIEAINFVMRTNKRRNLTSSQWAAVAVEADDLIELLKEEAEIQRRQKISESRSGVETVQLIAPSQKEENKVRTQLANTFNTNKTYISDAQKIKNTNPEVFEQIKRGEKTITEVKKEEKIEQRKKLIEEQREDIKAGTAKLPEGVFEVLAVDPPWNYGREYDPEGSRVANPYPEMTQQELLQMEMPSAKDAVMFLWTTHKFLFDAKELLEKWGFEYKATMVWDKEKIGMGAWLRMQCEFCLVGIKGKPTWDNTTWRDIIREPRREHSRKPETFYQMVEEITVGRRLDYFSRQQREGWSTFGNDVSKF
jgi:N6-adenosine-specific RNA methylase IME4